MQDPKHGAAFSYDDQGERKLRKSQYGETAYINQFFTVRNGAIASTHVYAGTSRIVTKVGAGTPVGKVSNSPKGTGNLDPNAATGGEIVVGDIPLAPTSTTPQLVLRPGSTATPATTAGTTTPTSGSTATTATATTTPTPSPLAGDLLAGSRPLRSDSGVEGGRGEGRNSDTFPGQGLEHRSDRANEVAQNTVKNKHLNGGDAGGEPGAGNSNTGGNGNATGTSNNNGGTGGSNAGGNAGGTGNGTDNTGGNTNTNGGGGQGNGREFIYFYHPDHLGSTGYVTDEKALRYEHITYFPFGETWVQESNATWRVPYQFTSKELDQETGLYYFGARYYDPRTSVWQSADPILGRYLNGQPSGGVFIPINLGLYGYSAQNPIRFKDDDGNFVNFIVGAIAGAATDIALQVAVQVATGQKIDIDITSVVISAGTGALGVGIAQKLSKVKQLSELSTTKLGKIGEQAVGIESKGKKTIESLSGTAKRRHPDRIDDVGKKIEEVKNKAKLSKSDAKQINDTVLYGQQEGYEAVLHGRKGMELGPEVQGLIDKGLLTYKQIPGVDAKGLKDLSNSASSMVGGAAGAVGGAGTRAVENLNN